MPESKHLQSKEWSDTKRACNTRKHETREQMDCWLNDFNEQCIAEIVLD